MVAHLVRLRLALLLASVRPGARERPRLVAGLVFVVLGVAAAWAGLLALRTTSDVAAQAVTVVGGAAVALGFLAAPLAVGGQDQLDPRRFRPFGATSGPLAAGVAVASLVSVPMLALIVVAVGVGTLWSTSDAGAAMVAGPALGVMTTVLLARIGWAGSTRVLRGHRSRELSGLFLVALLVVVVPVGVFFASFAWQGGVPSGLLGAVRLVSFTPLGAGWALPGAAATGDPLLWLVALLAVAWPVSLATIWYAVVDRMLHAPDRPASSRLRSGMSWFAVMPATPAGAIAARSLIYWLGDRRYRVNVVIVPVAALLTAVPLLIAGVPAEIVTLVPLPIAALFLGWLPHNDVAYDATAVWLHIASGVRGISDRVGRLVPVLFVGVPAIAVLVPVTAMLSGRWAFAPAITGVCISLFLSGLGLSSVASAAAPYPVSRPGDSPFHQPQRTGSAGMWAQALVMVGTVGLSAPTLWWAGVTVTRDTSFALAALAGGIATGVLVLGIGLTAGAVVFERRSSALMEFAETAA